MYGKLSSGSSSISVLSFLQFLEFSDFASIQNLNFGLPLLVVSSEEVTRSDDCFIFEGVIEGDEISGWFFDIEQSWVFLLDCSSDAAIVFAIVLKLFPNLMRDLHHELVI